MLCECVSELKLYLYKVILPNKFTIKYLFFLKAALNTRKCIYTQNLTKTLFTWSGGTRFSGVSFFCFVSPRAWKQKKPTPLDRGPPIHVNRP